MHHASSSAMHCRQSGMRLHAGGMHVMRVLCADGGDLQPLKCQGPTSSITTTGHTLPLLSSSFSQPSSSSLAHVQQQHAAKGVSVPAHSTYPARKNSNPYSEQQEGMHAIQHSIAAPYSNTLLQHHVAAGI
jgi:hypothetical protein